MGQQGDLDAVVEVHALIANLALAVLGVVVMAAGDRSQPSGTPRASPDARTRIVRSAAVIALAAVLALVFAAVQARRDRRP